MLKFGLVLVLLVCTVTALFEREVGKNDWTKEFIGHVKHAKFGCDKKDVFVGTDNVIANINIRTGKTTWRRVLEESETIRRFEYEKCTLLTLTDTLRVWDSQGLLKWEEPNVIDARSAADGIIIVKKGSVSQRGYDGKPLWTYTEDHDYLAVLATSPLQILTTSNILTIEGPNSVTKKSLSTPVPIGETFSSNGKAVIIANQKAYIIDKSVTEHEWLYTERPVMFGDFIQVGNNLFKVENGLVRSEGLISHVGTENNNLYHAKYDSGTVRILNDHEVDTFKINATQPTSIFLRPYTSHDNKLLFNLLIVTESELLCYSRSQLVWKREEGLSSVDQVIWINMPSVEDSVAGNALVSFEARLQKQVEELIAIGKNTIRGLMALINRTPSVHKPIDFLQDRFGFSKIMLMITKTSVYAVHTSGDIIWKKNIVDFLSTPEPITYFKVIMVKTPHHYDEHPITPEFVTIITTSSGSYSARTNALTGEITKREELSLLVKDAFGVKDGSESSIVLVGDNDVQAPTSEKEIHYYNRNGNQFTGFVLSNGKPVQTWNIDFENTIVGFATHESTSNENIYSTVVQYGTEQLTKYLNPHLFAVATLDNDKLLEIYLIDSITGTIIYRTSHDSCEGPVTMLLDENIVLYHYTNTKPKRYQLSILELYSNTSAPISLFNSVQETSYSTYSLGRAYIKRQSFIFPYGVRTIASTRTTEGITSKHFLFGTTNDQTFAINQKFLDTRRPRAAPTAADQEEGLLPYNPYIPYNPKNVLSYNRTIHRISNIETSPSFLESTSHVIVTGLDMFYTRTAPSKQFDLLNDDFSHSLLVISTIGLLVLTAASKYFAQKRELNRLWK